MILAPDTRFVKNLSTLMSQSTANPPFPPYVVILFGVLAASTSSLFIRFAQATSSSIVISAYRLGIASIILLPLAITKHRQELRKLSSRDIGLGLISGSFLALHFITWISSLEYTTVASSVLFVSTTPLWVALLSPFTIKEPLNRFILIGLIIALAGGVLIGTSDIYFESTQPEDIQRQEGFSAPETFNGNMLALAGAVMAAGYLIIGRKLREQLSLIPYIFIVYTTAAFLLFGAVFAVGYPLIGYSTQTYLWFLLLALIPQLLGHSSYNWALRYLPAAFTSIVLLGEPIGATLLAYFFLQEVPSTVKIIGAVFILVGISISSIRNKPHRSQSSSNE